jgi:hypothetical protein
MRRLLAVTLLIAAFSTGSFSASGILFQSNWSTALGNSDAAIRDTSNAIPGPWSLYEVGGTVANNPNEMVVVNTTAPVGVTNSLRIQQQGSTGVGGGGEWSRVVRSNFTPQSTDYYVRYYIRNDDVGGTSQDHVVQPGELGGIYNDLTYLNKYSLSAGGWRPRLVTGANATDGHGGGSNMPNWQLASNTALAYGRWYRFEYFIHFTNANHIQVHPRIYDDANALIFQDADFIADPGYMPWLGFSDWTLAKWYSGAHGNFNDFQVTPSNLVNIEFGNNGSASSNNTGLYWYFAAVQLRSDTWPGPISGGGTVPLAPTGFKVVKFIDGSRAQSVTEF